jgi:hypothetical protein
MDIKAIAVALYDSLPRSKRNILYNSIINHPDFPFHDDPDDSHLGRWFVIATGDYEAPASQASLDVIMNSIQGSEGYSDTVITKIYQLYIDEINKIFDDIAISNKNVVQNNIITPAWALEELVKKLECPICMVNIINVCFVGCGHLVCASCNDAIQIRKCPTCRITIEKVQRIYL